MKYEPMTAFSLEFKAAKLLETMKERAFRDQGNIQFLAYKLKEMYDRGYDSAIITLGGLK